MRTDLIDDPALVPRTAAPLASPGAWDQWVRPYGRWLVVVVVAAAAALANDPYDFGLRAREALMLAALAFGLAILSTRRTRPLSTLHTVGAFAAVGVVVFAGPMADPARRNVVEIARGAAMLLATAAAVVVLASARVGAHDDAVKPSGTHHGRRRKRAAALAVFAAALTMMVAMHQVARDRGPLVIDEVLYLFQAATLTEPTFGRSLDPSLVDFFRLPQSFYREGILHGQYTPGWPLLLLVARRLGVQPWTNALFGAGAVVLTLLVGRRLMPPRFALLAAVLLAANPMFVDAGGDYFAHASTSFMLLAATLLLLDAERRSSPAREIAWGWAGLAIGVAVAIRPLSGVAVGASIWLWMMLRAPGGARHAARATTCLALGALPMVAMILLYNQATTGSAARFGYAQANGDLVDLGFGLRGIVGYDRLGAPVALADVFTPADAARNALGLLGDFASAVLPSASIVALLALTAGPLRERRSAAILAGFLLLPVLQSLYYFRSIRFYTELLPFVMLGTCALLARWRSHRVFVRSAALFAILAALLSLGGHFVARAGARDEQLRAARLVERAHLAHGDIVVFVSDDVAGEGMLGRLWWYDVPAFDGPIVVARDLGERNSELRRALSPRAAFRLVRTGSTGARIERLP